MRRLAAAQASRSGAGMTAVGRILVAGVEDAEGNRIALVQRR